MIKWKSIKPIAIILGLFGAGMLPCPDCGAPMIVHFWPVAVILFITNALKKKRRKEEKTEKSISE
ncbi:MAG: hypothetical protein JW908_01375 [Anaerolineales bacterium]|nr:hypothetical protein [Anaerolineales bacterium]